MSRWFSPELIWLLTRLLDTNLETRFTISKIMENRWFKKGFKHIEWRCWSALFAPRYVFFLIHFFFGLWCRRCRLTGKRNRWMELCVYLGLKVLIGGTGALLQLLKCAMGLGEGKGKVRWRSELGYPLELLWVYSDVTTHYCGTHLERKITKIATELTNP